MTLNAYFDESKTRLTAKGYVVNPFREIAHGIQFLVFQDRKNGLIRVYNGKKGVRLDLSQFEDPEFASEVRELLPDGTLPPRIVPFPLLKPQGPTEELDKIDEMIGIDESGKGDYFGPLCIAAVHVDLQTKIALKKLGVMDSKDLSDSFIEELVPEIKARCAHSIIVMGNHSYNEIYAKMKNLNHILAWGHARVLENVLAQVECPYAVSDQFANPVLVRNALMKKGREITLFSQHKAERYVAVAAASILARHAFVTNLKKMEVAFQIKFPKGCSVETRRMVQEFVARYGREDLGLVAKLHFKLTGELA